MPLSIADRVVGCLLGIATGDAIGKQTEGLSHEDVLRFYPSGVRGFEGRRNSVIPRYVGNAKREWRIGETTDDTERTLAVARAIIAEQGVRRVRIAQEMLTCTKCVHPGVRSLWEFHQAADPTRIADAHDGCGAPIRVAPVGILYGSDCIVDLVNAAREASISTHGGSLAVAAAAANAAAVSAAIDGAAPRDILEVAQRAATLAESRWPGRRLGPVLGAAIGAIHESLAGQREVRPADVAARWFPDQPLTIVPLALGLGTILESAEEAILLAANIGGDSDSVASIAGGILGARHPSTVNADWCEVVELVNQHGLTTVARELVWLRRGCGGSSSAAGAG